MWVGRTDTTPEQMCFISSICSFASGNGCDAPTCKAGAAESPAHWATGSRALRDALRVIARAVLASVHASTGTCVRVRTRVSVGRGGRLGVGAALAVSAGDDAVERRADVVLLHRAYRRCYLVRVPQAPIVSSAGPPRRPVCDATMHGWGGAGWPLYALVWTGVCCNMTLRHARRGTEPNCIGERGRRSGDGRRRRPTAATPARSCRRR